MPIKAFVRRLAITVSLLMAGCAQIPTTELTQYRQASAEAQRASEDILVDFAAIKEASAAEQRRRDAAASGPPSPVFSTDLEHARLPEPDAVTVRRTALRTIDTYNNTLAALAEGKSVETVRTAAGGFVEAGAKFVVAAGGSVVPGLGALTAALQTVLGEIEKARLREEFDKAVRRGAPIVNRIVDLLIEERADHITLRAAQAEKQQVNLIDQITVQARNVNLLVRTHSAPAADDPRSDLEQRMNAQLKRVERYLLGTTLPVRLAYGTSMPPFGSEQRVAAEQAISQMTERVQSAEANVAQMEKLRGALNNYGALLRQMQAALNTLVAALDRPQNLDSLTENILATAFSLRKNLEEFRAARNAAN